MTQWERIMAAVKGQPLDRAPVSFFGHNHPAERDTQTLVKHLIEQNEFFGWDFMKVQLPNTYYGKAWGCEYRWDETTSPTHGWITVEGAVKSANDLKKIKELDPKKGIIGEQLKVIELLKSHFKDEIPLVHTIFTPLTVVKRLTGTEIRTTSEVALTQRFMEEDPTAMHYALNAVCQTFAEYAKEAIRAGADGIFMTTTAWSLDTISEEKYKEFGRPYDLPIYEAAIDEGASLNILHLCRDNIFLDLFVDYPVQIISYDSKSERNPDIDAVLNKTDKAFWGGIDHTTTLVNGPIENIFSEVHDALDISQGKRIIIGPGCSILPQTPKAHLHAAKDAICAWK